MVQISTVVTMPAIFGLVPYTVCCTWTVTGRDLCSTLSLVVQFVSGF